MKNVLFFLVVVTAGLASGEGGLRFHAVFTDHMVLQRDQPVVLKGYARPGAEVCAELGGAKACAKADERGRWRVTLPAMKAGGPYKAKASAGGKTVTLDDVMIGELWLCSGQSNMEMPVWGAGQFYRLTNGLEVAAAADDPDLRIAQINRTDGDKGPVEEPGTDPRWWKGWQRANTAEAVKPFSATAYFFGKELRRRLGVPVGIVASSWGGTKIDPWIANKRPPQVYFDGFVHMSNWIARVEKAAGETSVDARANWMRKDLDAKAWTKTMDFALPAPEIRWYRWTVELPAGAEDVRFQSTGITDTDETWFDGERIGAVGIDTYCHWSVRRDYPAKAATGGRHVVALRCFNHAGPGGIGNAKLVWKGGEIDLLKTEALTRTEARPTKATGGRPWSPWDMPFPRGYGYEPAYYNGMIAPLEGLQFRGVAWYQGCSDQKEWDKYDDWQRKLVSSWRENLGRPDLAFICVQLAGLHENRPDKPFTAEELAAIRPTEGDVVHIRAEQDRIRRVKGCECVTAFDIGTANDVHAKNKSEVGRRLAAAAANLCYGAKVPVRGPRPLSFVRDGSAVLVKFDAPIWLAGGSIGPHEFTLKALGGERTWADAELVAPDTVRVSSPAVENPLRVDYAWVPYMPKASLYNAEGYPVMPFRKYVADPAHYPRARFGKESILAHRGMSEEAPENTPAAYEKAVGNGFGFECDVYLTKDGRVFSFHDPDLRRIAGVNKACKDCTWDEVKDLDVGKWKDKKWAGQHPSTFEDIMALARDGRWIEVDVKAGPAVVPYLKKLLAAQGNASPRNLFFASSNPKTIRAVREQMPEYGAWLGETCRTGWSAADPAVPVEKMVEDLRANKANGVCLQFSSDIVTEDYIWALKDAGYPVNVWTVDDPAEARLALERGADSVTSNNPNKLLSAQ